jgi:1-acyl-sn-glycerol-3-phosphate acyltransferase
VTRWKSGFWHIARGAGVPIVPAYFNYPDKTIGIGPLFETSDDMDADLQPACARSTCRSKASTP